MKEYSDKLKTLVRKGEFFSASKFLKENKCNLTKVEITELLNQCFHVFIQKNISPRGIGAVEAPFQVSDSCDIDDLLGMLEISTE